MLERLPLIGRWFTKSSKGERKLVSLMGTHGWMPSLADAQHAELAGHMRGWNYVAINTLASAVAQLEPRVAMVRDQKWMATQRKAIASDWIRTKSGKRKAWRQLQKRMLPHHLRRKALHNLQHGSELEPVEEDHRLMRLMRDPNGPDTWYTLVYRLEMYLRLMGTAYLWAVPGEDGLPSELWVLPTHWVRPQGDEKNLVSHYEVRPSAGFVATDAGMGWFVGGAGMMEIPADEIVQISYPHPLNYMGGLSPLAATGEWTDCAQAIDTSRTAQFRNKMMPGVVLEIDASIEAPDEPTMERILAKVQERYAGVMKTGKPIMLDPGVKIVPVTHSVVEMDYVNSSDQLKSWILATHKTGESVVGLAENTTYASMVAASANFHHLAVKPEAILIGGMLTEKLSRRFDENLVVYFDDPVMPDPDAEQRKWDSAYQNGCVTPNEYRTQWLGLEPFETYGDDPMVPMGLSPIPLQTGDDAEDLPIPALASQGQEQPGGDGASEGEIDLGGLARMMSNGNGVH